MPFNSLDFLFFLSWALVGYWLLTRTRGDDDSPPEPPRGPYRRSARERLRALRKRPTWVRLSFVFLISCVFYMAWNPAYIGLILFSTVLDFLVGHRMHASKGAKARRAWLLVSLAGNLGLLGVFKYYNFFVTAHGQVRELVLFGVALGQYIPNWNPPLLNVLLPVGISFYTFQTLSYTIDIYRRRLAPAQSFIEFAAYVTFFPQLVAGPIVRAAEFLPQLRRTPWLNSERVSRGFFLIAMGLTKKIVFADFIAVNLVDRVFADPSRFSGAETVVGLYGFTLQIYADFSGYTDVARGAALLFGIELPENFDRPYQATSVAEFWRRWHMTLSSWLRDYLYFPLGGSKHGTVRTYFNLWLTIFLIGLWHGASWTFVVYGNLQAIAVMSNRALARLRRKMGHEGEDPLWLNVMKIALTMQFVVFSRILFRAEDMSQASAVTSQLFAGTWSLSQISPAVWTVLGLGFGLHYFPRNLFAGLRDWLCRLPFWLQGLLLAKLGAGLAFFVTAESVAYIYFQF